MATKSADSTIIVVNIFVNHDVLWSDCFPIIIECNLSVLNSKFLCNGTNELSNEKFKQLNLRGVFHCYDRTCDSPNHRSLIDSLYR